MGLSKCCRCVNAVSLLLSRKVGRLRILVISTMLVTTRGKGTIGVLVISLSGARAPPKSKEATFIPAVCSVGKFGQYDLPARDSCDK